MVPGLQLDTPGSTPLLPSIREAAEPEAMLLLSLQHPTYAVAAPSVSDQHIGINQSQAVSTQQPNVERASDGCSPCSHSRQHSIVLPESAPDLHSTGIPDWPSGQPFTPHAGDNAPAHRRIAELLNPSHEASTPELMGRVRHGLPSAAPADANVEMSPEVMGAQERAGQQPAAQWATPDRSAPGPVQGQAVEQPMRVWHENGPKATPPMQQLGTDALQEILASDIPDADERSLQAWRLQMQARSPEMGSEPHSPGDGASDEEAMQLVDSEDESDQPSTPTHAADNMALGRAMARQPSSPLVDSEDQIDQASTPARAANNTPTGRDIVGQATCSPSASDSMQLVDSGDESDQLSTPTHSAYNMFPGRVITQLDEDGDAIAEQHIPTLTADWTQHQMAPELSSSAEMSDAPLGPGPQGVEAPAPIEARSALPAADPYQDEPALKLQQGSAAPIAPTTPGFAFHGSRASRVSTPGR